MSRTAREVLDIIDELLVEGTTASMHLAWVLSAIRGPDGMPGVDRYVAGHVLRAMKDSSTAVIRSHAFPRTAAKAQSRRTSFGSHSFAVGMHFAAPDLKEVRLPKPPHGLSHFCMHIKWAASALGLPFIIEKKKKEEEEKL